MYEFHGAGVGEGVGDGVAVAVAEAAGVGGGDGEGLGDGDADGAADPADAEMLAWATFAAGVAGGTLESQAPMSNAAASAGNHFLATIGPSIPR